MKVCPVLVLCDEIVLNIFIEIYPIWKILEGIQDYHLRLNIFYQIKCVQWDPGLNKSWNDRTTHTLTSFISSKNMKINNFAIET